MRALALALALVATGFAAPAAAYVRNHLDPNDPNSRCLYWGSRSVPFKLSARGSSRGNNDAVLAALRASLATWGQVSCSDFKFEDQGLTDSTAIGFNKVLLNQPFLAGDVPSHNTIVFRSRRCADVVPASDDCNLKDNDDCENVYDCWKYADNVIALTTTTYSYMSGQMFDGDIELNEADFVFTTTDPPAPLCTDGGVSNSCINYDLRNTVTHEAGHLLGLGHSAVSSATMFFQAPRGQTSKRVLAQDDVDGLCSIYPAGQPTQQCVPESSSKGCGCGAVDGAWALPGLLILARRRRRS